MSESSSINDVRPAGGPFPLYTRVSLPDYEFARNSVNR